MVTGLVVDDGCKAKEKFSFKGHRIKILLTLALLPPLLVLNGCAGIVSGKSQAASPVSFSISPTTLNFGKAAVGQKMTQNLTLTNTGTVGVTIEQASFSNSQFGVSGASFPMSISAGQSTGLAVWMNGTAAGNLTGTLTVQANSGTTPGVVNLSGTVTASSQPQISLTPAVVDFGNVTVGSKGSSSFAIGNNGSSDLTVSVVTMNGAEFGISGIATPKTISSGQTVPVTVTFNPTTTGTALGSVTITSNDPTNPTSTVSLTGTGTTTPAGQLTASSTSLSFSSVSVGSNATKSITLTNSGTVPVQVNSITWTGAGFSVSGVTAPFVLSASQIATLNVKFAPTAAGTDTGSISVVSNATGSPLAISLNGTATTAPSGQLTVSPSTVNFGSVVDGSNSSKTITLTNTGNAALQITNVGATGTGFSESGVNAPVTLNPSQSVTLTTKFAPSSAGSAVGTITIADSAGSPVTVTLSGTGTTAPTGQLTASSTNVSFGSVATGGNASQNITLTNSGTAALQITSISSSGTGFSASGISTPMTLNPSQTATLAATFAPASAGSASGTITVANNAGSPVTIALNGTGTQSGLSISPATFNFGSIVDGQTKSQNFTLTNTGTATLTVTQISVTGAGYSASGLNTPTTIGVGQTATFSVLFAPANAGGLNGSVSVSSNAPTSPNVATLAGTGVAASVTISPSPSSLSFGSVSAGSSSSKSVTITNGGNSNVTLSQVTVSAKDVSASGISMPMTLTPGQNASLNVAFSPSASESVTGNVTVTTTQGTSAVIAVSGSGTQAALALTPSSVSFGNVTVGAPNSQTIQISNTGTAVLTISQLSVTGTGFSTSSVGLPLSINPGAASTFNVQFAPQSAGSASGSVSLVSNAPNSPSVLALSGAGIAATTTISLSSNSLNFGSVNTGSSAQQNVTITDTGNANVTISQIGVTGSGYSLTGAGTPVTLSPNQTLTFTVHFSPSSAGTDNGSVSIVSNATGSPTSVSLAGTAVAQSHTVALSWNASTSTVSGYNVYRSSTSGSGYSKVNGSLVGSLNFTDSSVQNGATYYYVTTAVDSSGDESSYSNEAQAIIP
jgi:Abnormal spindle-like microcephaly-assoc'd, ASPM-SPD-2-Hydin/Protein of unknown function (DUF1573)